MHTTASSIDSDPASLRLPLDMINRRHHLHGIFASRSSGSRWDIIIRVPDATSHQYLVWTDKFVQWIRRRASANLAENSHSLTSKGVPNGRHQWTERDHARDRACRVDRKDRGPKRAGHGAGVISVIDRRRDVECRKHLAALERFEQEPAAQARDALRAPRCTRSRREQV